MAGIVERCQAAAATCKSGSKNYAFTFYHMEAEELNAKEAGDEQPDSKVKFPFTFLEFPLVGIDEVIFNRTYTTYALRLFFGNMSVLTDNMLQRKPTIEDMELAKNEFLMALFFDGEVEIIGKPTMTQTIEAIDFTYDVDGVYLNMQVKLETTPLC